MNPKENNWSKHRGIYFQIGMIVSLGLVLTAFEWKSYPPPIVITCDFLRFEETDSIQYIPEIPRKIPPPPKVQPKPEVIEDTDKEDDLSEMIFDTETEDEIPEVYTDGDIEETEEEVDEILYIVEEPAHPIGGHKAFFKFIATHLKYPKKAKRMKVEGMVFIQFVIDKDGKIIDVETTRGIGAGCDEEAIRVVKMAPAWKPGKQRGKAVKQRISIPIRFKLE
jgi:protein TonB